MRQNTSNGGTLAELLARAASSENYNAWLAQVRQARYCTHPVRLTGQTRAADPTTGELSTVFSSAGQPDGVLLKVCGQRRSTVCPSCAAVYRFDAWQLIAAGLQGGKGVSASVATHPMVFVTLTAPSFGPVHACRVEDGRNLACRPRRQSEACEHGVSLACWDQHDGDDELLGQPLCAACFDYNGAVLWNSLASELWRRTTIYLRRALAQGAGLTVANLDRQIRLSYARVVEYQRRGLVHVHAVIRLDPKQCSDPAGNNADPAISTEALVAATLRAAAIVSVPYPEGHRDPVAHARWGEQIDVRPIKIDGDDAAAARAVAAYISKYATKSTDAFGHLDHRLRADDLTSLAVNPHLRRLVESAWTLGARQELAHLRLRYWAHTLGFRGHWLTKSRHYSTTLGALRSAREEWAAERRRQRTQGYPGARRGDSAEPVPVTDLEEEPVLVKDWRYVARGYTTWGDALLVETARLEAEAIRRIAREEAGVQREGVGVQSPCDMREPSGREPK
ncbi:MAG: replication initiator [Acidimicrobiales bacterium]